jgi:hypothetical protein
MMAFGARDRDEVLTQSREGEEGRAQDGAGRHQKEELSLGGWHCRLRLRVAREQGRQERRLSLAHGVREMSAREWPKFGEKNLAGEGSRVQEGVRGCRCGQHDWHLLSSPDHQFRDDLQASLWCQVTGFLPLLSHLWGCL